jgi:peptide/nickel transport system substrate-binding protein
MVTWEHGAFMEMAANDNYFLGRPKIDRVKVLFIDDTNTMVANMWAGEVNIVLPTGGPDWDQLKDLKTQWQANSKGDVVIERVRWQFVEPQKGSLAQPTDLRDVRVRQALHMAINREELTRSLQGDQGGVAHNWVHPSFAQYAQVKDVTVEVPYDPRRATALLAEVGWTPGSDGVLMKGGQRFTMQVRPGEAREKEATIIAQDWKAIGIDGQMEILSDALLRDAEARATYSGSSVNQNPMGGLSAVRRFATDQIPATANRWAGTNRGAFSSPAWDDIGLRLRTAIDDDQRLQLERELLRVFHSEVPAMALQYELQAVPVLGIRGLQPITGTAHTGNIMHTWNAHEWDMLR